MAPDKIKDHLPDSACRQGHQVDREEIEAAVDEIGKEVVRRACQVEARHDCAPPTCRTGQAQGLQSQIGLVAGVPHGHEDAGEQGDDHQDHDPLQVHCIPDMGRRAGGMAAPHEKGVHCVKGWVPAYQAATLVEEGGGFL